jgi:hypothetical protein
MSKPDKSQPEFINLLDAPAVDIKEVIVEEPTGFDTEEGQEEPGNMAAAMNKVAETLNMTRKTNTGSKTGEPAQRQVLLRASAEDHERWKKTAESKGMALSELIRELCNIAAAETLDCQHPAEFRKTYKWSDTCLKCNTRLRGWQ